MAHPLVDPLASKPHHHTGRLRVSGIFAQQGIGISVMTSEVSRRIRLFFSRAVSRCRFKIVVEWGLLA